MKSANSWIHVSLSGCAIGLLLSGCQATEPVTVEASDLLPLPEFEQCQSTIVPTLPAKWTATALMQDFVLPFMVAAEFTYDESAEAFEFSLASRYGIDADFLVTSDRRLYLLEDGQTSCSHVTDESPFTVPSRNWVDQQGLCVGEAPILEQDLAWWKTPRDQGADWVWFNTDNNLPFRTMYYEDEPLSDPAPIYEHFTFNYYPSFSEVSGTNLGELVALCEQSTATTQFEQWDLGDIATLAEAGTYPQPDTASAAKFQNAVPGLSECSSPSDLPPPWPEQVQGTVFMTAVSFDPNPFPTRVFYDWEQKAQNTSLYYYPPPTEPTGDDVQVALLTGDTGYIRIEDKAGDVTMCQQALPGPQVPDWNSVDGCQCRAQIAPGTILNPSTVPTKIMWCPTDLSAQQVFWTWYSDEGSPVVFMQTNSSPTAGTGLNLADYYEWEPGSIAPAGTFDVPPACEGEPKVEVPTACHNCHLPTNS